MRIEGKRRFSSSTQSRPVTLAAAEASAAAKNVDRGSAATATMPSSPLQRGPTLVPINVNHLKAGHDYLKVFIPKTHEQVAEWVHWHLTLENEKVVGFDVEWRPSFRKGAPQNKIALVQISTVKSCILIQLKHLRTAESLKSKLPSAPSIPSALAEILNSSKYVKVGVGIKEDLDRLRKDWGCTHDGSFIDVGLVGKRLYRERNKPQRKIEGTTASSVSVSVSASLSVSALSGNNNQDMERNSDSVGSPAPVAKPGFGLASLAKHYLDLKIVKSSSIQCSDWESPVLRSRQIEYASYDALLGRLLYEHFVAECAFRDKKEIVLSLIQQSAEVGEGEGKGKGQGGDVVVTTTNKLDSLVSFGRGEARRALTSSQEDSALTNLLGERIQENDESSLHHRLELQKSDNEHLSHAGSDPSQDIDIDNRHDSWRQILGNYLARLGLGYKIVVNIIDESPLIHAKIVALDGTIEGNVIASGVGRNKKVAAERACRDALIGLVALTGDELRKSKEKGGEGGKDLIMLYSGRGSRTHPLFLHLLGKTTKFMID